MPFGIAGTTITPKAQVVKVILLGVRCLIRRERAQTATELSVGQFFSRRLPQIFFYYFSTFSVSPLLIKGIPYTQVNLPRVESGGGGGWGEESACV